MKKQPIAGSFKTGLFLCLILVFAFAFGACKSMLTKYAWDPELPESEVASLIPYYGQFDIISYNGVAVEWTVGALTSYEVKIPAGEATLEVNVDYYMGNVRYKGSNLIVRHTFRAGTEYYLTLGRVDGAHGLYVEDQTTMEKVFTPFLNTGGKRVLQ